MADPQNPSGTSAADATDRPYGRNQAGAAPTLQVTSPAAACLPSRAWSAGRDPGRCSETRSCLFSLQFRLQPAKAVVDGATGPAAKEEAEPPPAEEGKNVSTTCPSAMKSNWNRDACPATFMPICTSF